MTPGSLANAVTIAGPKLFVFWDLSDRLREDIEILRRAEGGSLTGILYPASDSAVGAWTLRITVFLLRIRLSSQAKSEMPP